MDVPHYDPSESFLAGVNGLLSDEGEQFRVPEGLKHLSRLIFHFYLGRKEKVMRVEICFSFITNSCYFYFS